jgi:hypothetical protein
MILFGLRLALAGGREAVVRLLVIAAAVALGVGLLLSALAGVNAVDTQNQRYGWLNTGLAKAEGSPDPLWWLLRTDYFHGRTIARVDVAATGPDAAVPPGIPRLPGPGEFYASPALSELLRTTPAGELGDRFPGRQVGTIGDEAVPGPDMLLVIVGHRPDEIAHQRDAVQVTGIMSTDPKRCDACYVGNGADAVNLVLGVVAVAILFPILILISTATRLAAARREQRFAAMRLVGATPRQISVIATVESTVSAVFGTALGFVLFLLFGRALAGYRFTPVKFFPADLTLHPRDVLLVAIGVPLGTAVAARLALRRVRISPFGVSRRVTPRPPRAWRLIPLLAGTGELGYFLGRRPDTSQEQLVAYLSGILIMMIGLVVAGPWLTMVGSRALARRASRPATIIAGRRLADNPHAGFRAVSGVTLALFVTSVATGVITTLVDYRGAEFDGSTYTNALTKIFWPERLPEGGSAPTVDQMPAQVAEIPGVRSVLAVRANPVDEPGRMAGVIGCADLARNPAAGRCAPGAQVVEVFPGLVDYRDDAVDPPLWPAADLTPEELGELPVLSFVVDTDGSAAAIERARTILIGAFPDGGFFSTDAEYQADFSRTLVQWQQLANVMIIAGMAVAGCSLAVAVASGLTERKRPFSLLRLTGVRLAVLRRVVLLETAVPLLVVAVLATGAGFLAAQLFLRSQLDYTLRPPGGQYYVMILAGLIASIGIIAATLPMLGRITGPETARNE